MENMEIHLQRTDIFVSLSLHEKNPECCQCVHCILGASYGKTWKIPETSRMPSVSTQQATQDHPQFGFMEKENLSSQPSVVADFLRGYCPFQRILQDFTNLHFPEFSPVWGSNFGQKPPIFGGGSKIPSQPVF